MNKRITMAAVTAVIISLCTTGCKIKYEADTETSHEESVLPEQQEGRTIRVMYNDTAYEKFLQECADGFEKEYENVSVIIEYAEDENYLENIMERSKDGKEIPDVYLTDSSRLRTAYLAGLAEKVGNGKSFDELYCETAINACSNNGFLTAYPLGFKTVFLAYNSAYVDGAEGFTFSDITDYSDNTEITGTETGLNIDKIFSCNLTDLFMNYGYVGNGFEIGGTYGSDSSIFSINNSTTMEAVQEYLAIIAYFSIDTEKSYDDVLEEFINGRNVFTILSTDSLGILDKEENQKLMFSEFPDYDGDIKTAPLSVTTALAVNPYSQDAALAEKFAVYSAETMAYKLYESSGILSASKKVTLADDRYSGIYKSYMKSDSKNKFQYGDQVYPLIEIALHNIIAGEDAETELEKVESYMKKQLN